MNVLKKCCFRSMKENRKRTLVTIIGVVLATALITGVACLAVSFRVSMIAYEEERNGSFHYCFYEVGPENIKIFKNNHNIESFGLVEEIGYAELKGSQNPDKPYLYIGAADVQGMEAIALHLKEGRLPENASELVIGRHIRSNGLVDLKVGDVLTLEVGNRMSDGCKLNQGDSYTYESETLMPVEEKTYTIVGIVERPNYVVEERMAPGYSAFTLLEEPGQAPANVYAVYTGWGLRHASQVNAGILGVSEDLYDRYYVNLNVCTEEEMEQIKETASGVSKNYWLLKWIQLSFSDSTISMLYSMAGLAMLIIVVTSVFCIRNAFDISLTEKMKLYGRLSSVGTTSAQQKKMVYYEALFLGVTGIPLGILSGVLASVILVKVVSGLVETALDVPLIFGVSFPAIAAAAVLAAVTILLSARKSARRAAKLSPIGAIRGNDSIRIRRRELKCPRFVDKLFGVGGRIAYKNLKRARAKYRTTVISIVVSVAVFIGLTTFTQLLAFATGFYYENRQYQIQVTLRGDNAYERAQLLAALDGVEAVDIRQAFSMNVTGSEIPFTHNYESVFGVEEEEPIGFITLGDSGYAEYCRLLGISVEKAQEKAIVLAEYENTYFSEEDNKIHTTSGRIADYRAGDVIEGEDGENKISVEVLLQTDKKPMSMESEIHNFVTLIVSDRWAAEHLALEEGRWVYVYFRCEDASALEESIRMNLTNNFSLYNYDADYKSQKAIYTVLSIFLYGFITVVALIGITNIFNTITTNMELRAPDFAMLRSVGMTGREFRRMIWLEGFFYGGKALLIGIPFGLVLSLGFHRALAEGIETGFQVPWAGIAIAVAAVAALLFGIMHYSMGRIKRKNIIETIQNENI